MDDRIAGPVSRAARLVRRIVWELVTTVVPAVAIALFVNVYVAQAVTIEDGPSMQPNLYRGYRVMTEKLSYRLHPPRRGDVVVVDRPGPEVSLIKRVIAVAGEMVEVRGGHTTIDGEPIEEPWVVHFGGPDYGPALVPEDHVFVMGDNRRLSRDSRAIGPVPVDTVQGRAWLVYWPSDDIKLLLGSGSKPDLQGP
jgi:signal peptidase I